MIPKLTLRALPVIALSLLHLPLALGLPGGSCDLAKRANTTKTEAEIWGGITPSKDLVWHPCYAEDGTIECARLQVPLDYSNTEGRDAGIALIRKPATTQEGYRGPVLFNPGGPGGSGVDFIRLLGNDLATIIGPQYDIVSFDPRGIARSTPRATHFGTDVERVLFTTGISQFPVVKDGKASGIERIWAQFWVLGSLAASHDDGYLQHITTENTATDMLSIVRAYGQEKLQYWGFSYGTVLGATFAAMYPDKIERMVLDGVVDAEDYYDTKWLTALVDSDKVLQLFFDNCAEAGPTLCPLYAADPADIRRNLTALQDKILAEPVAVRTDTFYGIVDHSTLSLSIFSALYGPFSFFRDLANALAQLAGGDGAPLLSLYSEPVPYKCDCDEHAHEWDAVAEGTATIACNDGAEVPGSVKELQEYWDELAGVSQFADYVGTVRAGCTNWPKNKKPFRGPFVGNTSYPVLVIGNTADPITPLSSAKKMAQGFKDAVVLTLDAGGHCTLGAPSLCAQLRVRQYFQDGTLPEEGTVCDPLVRNPFIPPPSESPSGNSTSGSGLKARQGEDAELLAAVQKIAGKVNSVFKVPGASGMAL